MHKKKYQFTFLFINYVQKKHLEHFFFVFKRWQHL